MISNKPLIFFCFFVLSGVKLIAADAPGWLCNTALTPLPSYKTDIDMVVLLDDRAVTIDDRGTIVVHCRRAVKVLRRQGCEKASILAVQSGFDIRIRNMTGWRLAVGQKTREVSYKEAFETGLAPDVLYTDAKIKILQVPDVDLGNIVGFEWEIQRTPLATEDIFFFQGTFPVCRVSYTINLLPSSEYSIDWVNWQPEKPQPVKGPPSYYGIRWEWQNIPPIEVEPFAPDSRAISGRLIARFRVKGSRDSYFPVWGDIGVWYNQLTSDCLVVDESLAEKTRHLASSIPDTAGKLQALADFVQKEIRYVAVEIGMGGFKPHPASSIFSNRYGDCKDKTTLLSAMLRVMNVESYYMLTNTARGVIKSDSPAALYSFDHVILAIVLPSDVPDGVFASVVRHPKLGRLLIFDPTSPYTPLGRLPLYLQGNTALLAIAEGSELLNLPLPNPENNLLERKSLFSLLPDGTLQGEVIEKRRGYLADQSRAEMLNSTIQGRTKYIEMFLGHFFVGFSLQEQEIRNLEENQQELIVTYRISVPRYAKNSGNFVIIRPCVLGDKNSNIEINENTPRHFPIYLESTSLQMDDFRINLPERWTVKELPPAVNLETDFASYKSSAVIKGSTLVYIREYRLLDPILSASRFEEVKKLFREINADERNCALIVKSDGI